MALGQTIAQLRKDRNMTQEELASRLYVTRQAVSRWENGETMPGIDMCKLLATVLEVPVSCLLEMPEMDVCQSCGMPLYTPQDHGTEADGSPAEDFCTHCYQRGAYTYEADMDSMIEGCAPFLSEQTGISLDEAVSLMGAMLPKLKRWSAVNENERRYGAEARARFGDELVDAANDKLVHMSDYDWNNMNALENKILEQLTLAMEDGDATGPSAQHLCAMHTKWIQLHWPDGAYSPEAHLGLAHGYLQDKRFTAYYDEACGEGATQFLVSALEEYLAGMNL